MTDLNPLQQQQQPPSPAVLFSRPVRPEVTRMMGHSPLGGRLSDVHKSITESRRALKHRSDKHEYMNLFRASQRETEFREKRRQHHAAIKAAVVIPKATLKEHKADLNIIRRGLEQSTVSDASSLLSSSSSSSIVISTAEEETKTKEPTTEDEKDDNEEGNEDNDDDDDDDDEDELIIRRKNIQRLLKKGFKTLQLVWQNSQSSKLEFNSALDTQMIMALEPISEAFTAANAWNDSTLRDYCDVLLYETPEFWEQHMELFCNYFNHCVTVLTNKYQAGVPLETDLRANVVGTMLRSMTYITEIFFGVFLTCKVERPSVVEKLTRFRVVRMFMRIVFDMPLSELVGREVMVKDSRQDGVNRPRRKTRVMRTMEITHPDRNFEHHKLKQMDRIAFNALRCIRSMAVDNPMVVIHEFSFEHLQRLFNNPHLPVVYLDQVGGLIYALSLASTDLFNRLLPMIWRLVEHPRARIAHHGLFALLEAAVYDLHASTLFTTTTTSATSAPPMLRMSSALGLGLDDAKRSPNVLPPPLPTTAIASQRLTMIVDALVKPDEHGHDYLRNVKDIAAKLIDTLIDLKMPGANLEQVLLLQTNLLRHCQTACAMRESADNARRIVIVQSILTGLLTRLREQNNRDLFQRMMNQLIFPSSTAVPSSSTVSLSIFHHIVLHCAQRWGHAASMSVSPKVYYDPNMDYDDKDQEAFKWMQDYFVQSLEFINTLYDLVLDTPAESGVVSPASGTVEPRRLVVKMNEVMDSCLHDMAPAFYCGIAVSRKQISSSSSSSSSSATKLVYDNHESDEIMTKNTCSYHALTLLWRCFTRPIHSKVIHKFQYLGFDELHACLNRMLKRYTMTSVGTTATPSSSATTSGVPNPFTSFSYSSSSSSSSLSSPSLPTLMTLPSAVSSLTFTTPPSSLLDLLNARTSKPATIDPIIVARIETVFDALKRLTVPPPPPTSSPFASSSRSVPPATAASTAARSATTTSWSPLSSSSSSAFASW